MASFEGAHGPDFERFLNEANAEMSKAQEMKQRLAETVGRGEAAQGRISAEFRGEGGLTALDLDPRALRMPSGELSQEIRAAVNAAMRDFQKKMSQVRGELFGTDGPGGRPVDPQKALAQIERMGNAFATQMQSVLRELSANQRKAADAMNRLSDPPRGF